MEVEVKDPPKGMIPPGTQMVKPKAEPQPSKVSSTRAMNMHTNTPTSACMLATPFKYPEPVTGGVVFSTRHLVILHMSELKQEA